MKTLNQISTLLFIAFFCVSFTPVQSVTLEELQEYAIKQTDSNLMEILINYGDSDASPVLNRAMQAKDYFAVSVLISCGVDINSRSENGETVLEMAIDRGEIPLVEYFLMNNADPTNQQKQQRKISSSPLRRTDYYLTAVYYAIMKDRLDVLKLFTKYGVDLNKVCYEITSSTYEKKNKQTPIQVAIEMKKKNLVAFLLSIGVDV